MWIPLLLCYIGAGAVSLAFLRFHINLFKYPLYYVFPIVLAVYLPLSITFLLPTDYVSHVSGKPIQGFEISDNTTLMMWKSNYWSTFILTWLLLPVLQEYYRAGNYLKIMKLKTSLRQNLKFQAMVLLLSIAGGVYLILEKGLSLSSMKSMIISMSHIYALVLALWLMAHGLITIPRNRWNEGNILQNLNHYYLKVPKLVDTLEDTRISFKEDILQVLILKNNFTSSAVEENFAYRDWILNLANQVPSELEESVGRQYVHSDARSITREQLNEAFMNTLTYSFQGHMYKLRAYNSEYDTLLANVSRLQTLLEAKATEDPEERLRIMSSFGGLISPSANFYLQCYAKPVLARLLSIFLFVISFVIIQSEFFHSTKFSIVNIIVFKTGIHNHNLFQAIFSGILFLYMLFCSLNSLTRLKIFNMYHLVPGHSDPVSTCFYVSYIARLTIPLSYNFLTFFTDRSSIFEDWYGKSIHLTGLFDLMNSWVPRLLLVPVVLTTFNVYERLKKRIGLHSDMYGAWADFDDEEQLLNDENNMDSRNNRRELVIAEAKRTIAMELNRRNQTSRIHLRSFALQNAADSTYERNMQDFNLSLFGGINNRIDTYHDDNSTALVINADVQGLWSRLGGAVNNFKDAVQSRIARNSSYRDDPLDSYEYDEDAQENLVL